MGNHPFDEHQRKGFLASLWRWNAGKSELPTESAMPSISVLAETEWSPDFERLMRNRLIVGAMRYGRIGDTGKPEYDRIHAAVKRLKAYHEDGNLERLVDVANLVMLEYIEGKHPKRHWEVLDDGPHVRTK